MTGRHSGSRGALVAILAALASALLAPAALAQEGVEPAEAKGSAKVENSPFAPLKPGQTPLLNPSEPPSTIELGLLHWYPIASRCTFVAPDRAEEVVDKKDLVPFVFVTMVDETQPPAGQPGLERGYVMANGLVRELEKGRSTAGKDGAVITVWRSAGEPRINVNTVINGAVDGEDGTTFTGQLTVFWGDKKENVMISGRCR